MGNREIVCFFLLLVFVVLCVVVLFFIDIEVVGKIMRFYFNLGILGVRLYVDNRLS